MLTNEAMPGIIKIGLSERSIEQRLAELDNTSIPLPFQCYFAGRVEDSRKVERALHTAFGESRVRSSREFFTVDPFRVKAILELLIIEDVTPKKDLVSLPDDLKALEIAAKKRRRFSFEDVRITEGSILTFAQDQSITCVVSKNNSVIYRDSEMSLSAAALDATQRAGFSTSSISGPVYWLYEGESLDSIRRRLETE